MSAPTRWIVPALTVAAEADAPQAVVEDITPDEIIPPTLEELQAIRDEARQAGYEDGLLSGQAQGFAQGHSEVRRLIAQMEGILDNFTRPLARLEGEVTSALGALAVRIAGHLTRRAYADHPQLLADLLNEALDAVGSAAREVEVHLHPDDLGTLTAPEHALALPESVRLIPAPALSRGDLRVHTEHLRIDGSLNARLEQALEQVMRQAEAIS